MLCRITMSSQVLTHGEQLAGLAFRTITEALGTEPEGDNDARAVVSVLSDIYVSLLGHTHLQHGLPHERSKSQASQGSLKTKPVMLLDYLYAFHTQTYSDCSFSFRS